MVPPLYGRLIDRCRHGTCFYSTRGPTGSLLVLCYVGKLNGLLLLLLPLLWLLWLLSGYQATGSECDGHDPEKTTQLRHVNSKEDTSNSTEHWGHSFNVFCENTTFHGLRNVGESSNNIIRRWVNCSLYSVMHCNKTKRYTSNGGQSNWRYIKRWTHK